MPLQCQLALYIWHQFLQLQLIQFGDTFLIHLSLVFNTFFSHPKLSINCSLIFSISSTETVWILSDIYFLGLIQIVLIPHFCAPFMSNSRLSPIITHSEGLFVPNGLQKYFFIWFANLFSVIFRKILINSDMF